MMLISTLTSLIGTITHLSFAWGALFYFRNQDKNSKKAKALISILAGIFSFVNVWGYWFLKTQSLTRVALSCVLFIMSIGLFFWAINSHEQRKPGFAFSSTQPESLVLSGPYKWVRHPFYLAYSITWVSGAIYCSLWYIIFFFCMFAIYYQAAKLEERSFLAGPLKDAYANYIRSTGMFLPNMYYL